MAWLACLAAFGFAVLWWHARTRLRRRTRTRQRRSRKGEHRAEQVLTRRGFRILARQPFVDWVLRVDGDAVEVRARADLLVEAVRVRGVRRGTRFVAEVKTGTTAPDPAHPATRRQLLEYLHAFDVAGVLLVDMEAGAVRVVGFPDGWSSDQR